MKIEMMPPIQLNLHNKTAASIEKETPAVTNDFTHWLTDAVSGTNDKLVAADDALQQLASGQATSLHQTMLTLEEAKLSFQFLEQIRNRLMSAYQDILREQI